MTNLVTIKNNQAVVSSRQVAESFGKRHDNVLRDIEAIKKDALNFEEMFNITYLPDSYGRHQKAYLINRDGFTLLAMGFTGQKALEWKLKYIQAFNEMEKQLQDQQKIPALPATYLDALKALVASEEEKVKMLPKVKYHDDVLNTQNFMTITEVAKSEGLRSGQTLNKILEDKGVLYRVGYKSNALKTKSAYPHAFTAQYVFLIKEGYAKVSTHVYSNSKSQKTTHSVKWSEKGRKWLHDFLSKI